jgi:BON domain
LKLGIPGTWRGRLFLLGMAALACGCNNDDADRLARVGKLTAGKFETLTGISDGKVTKGLQAIRGEWDFAPPHARVSCRLRWEKDLADAEIQVSGSGGTVELRGKVRDLAQRRRAVEVAESTVGVETVTDSLELPAQEP